MTKIWINKLSQNPKEKTYSYNAKEDNDSDRAKEYFAWELSGTNSFFSTKNTQLLPQIVSSNKDQAFRIKTWCLMRCVVLTVQYFHK